MKKLDPAWLDAQYNNRARVPDHAAVLERWTQASAVARAGTARRLGVRYGAAAGEVLDVYPAPRDRAPVFVFVHGGYWRALSKDEHAFVAPSFVDRGAMVVVPDYALCPQVTIEDIALQLTRALAWVHRHAALYGGDPSRIVVGGHSAGGHLAAMLLCCQWRAVAPDLPRDLVKGAVSVSGLFDLEPLRHTPFLRADLRLTAASAARLSPAWFPAPDGPLHAFVGALESEEFQRQNALIRERWGGHAVPVCEAVPACNHFTVLHSLVDPEHRVHRCALHLLGLETEAAGLPNTDHVAQVSNSAAQLGG